MLSGAPREINLGRPGVCVEGSIWVMQQRLIRLRVGWLNLMGSDKAERCSVWVSLGEVASLDCWTGLQRCASVMTVDSVAANLANGRCGATEETRCQLWVIHFQLIPLFTGHLHLHARFTRRKSTTASHTP